MWGLLSSPEVVQTGFATDIGSDFLAFHHQNHLFPLSLQERQCVLIEISASVVRFLSILTAFFGLRSDFFTPDVLIFSGVATPVRYN